MSDHGESSQHEYNEDMDFKKLYMVWIKSTEISKIVPYKFEVEFKKDDLKVKLDESNKQAEKHKEVSVSLTKKVKLLESELDMTMTKLERLSSAKLDKLVNIHKRLILINLAQDTLMQNHLPPLLNTNLYLYPQLI